ncbi:MAG: hypothetical protein LBE89_06855 [Helicobacteraceae bacterium]|jgi:hypothetical protein|nr:hypothetical protein [Helicobacteraceae bacterium]
MKRFLLLFFCALAFFAGANEINLDGYSVKTVRGKDGKYSGIRVYDRDGALKQEEVANYLGCDRDPILLSGFDGEKLSFVFICGLGHAPEVFHFGSEENKFFSDEFAFGNADELLETKDHILVFSRPYSNNFGEIVCFNRFLLYA